MHFSPLPGRGAGPRAAFLGLLPALLLGCGGERDTLPENALARRVVLITCDTLRADRIGAYGYERPTTPRLDAFARECTVFDEAYSTSSITGPALSSLLTGLLPDEIGTPDNQRILGPDALSIAELARDAGYPTAAVVSNFVLRRYPGQEDAGVQQGFQLYDDEMLSVEHNRPHLSERVAPDTAAAAIRWLAAAQARGADRFFLWVHFQDPHGPYTPPPEYAAEFEREHAGERTLEVGPNRRTRGLLPSYQVLGDARQPGFYRDRYDAETRYFDDGFGTLIDWLDDAGWLDDALVVFSADHGESLGEHDYWFSHGEHAYRELVHVPLLVRYPDGTSGPSTARVSQSVSHLDLWPTFIEALGLEPHENRGVSLFAREIPDGRVHMQTVRAPRGNDRWSAVVDGRWRLVVPPRAEPQLYDLLVDPRESHDLARTHSAPLERLTRAREQLLRQLAPRLQSRKVSWTRTDLKALQGLGYVDGSEGDDDAGDGHGH